MKKNILILLAVSLTAAALAGCGNQSAEESVASSEEAQEQGTTAEESEESTEEGDKAIGEITEIIWQYPSTGNLGAGFDDVEAALNEMLEKDIGVHVTFEPCSLMDSQKEASLMVSAGEQLDISLTAFTSLGPLVDSELICPLDDLLDTYGQDIREHCGVLLDGCSYGTSVYGVPTAYTKGSSYGYEAKTEILDKYDIKIDPDKLYTVEEMEEIFAIVKEGEGDGFYCTVPWNTTQDPLNNSYMAYDKLSGSLSGGVLMLGRDFSDTTIYNLFETDEYKEYCEMMYRWAQKGYISPDAAVTTEAVDVLVASDNYLGTFYWSSPEDINQYEGTIGQDMTVINMIDGYVANNGGQVIMWNIPITSKSPEKAMETLNYIYKNKEAAWLLQFGLEDVSYEVVAEEDGNVQIQYLGETTALPYYQGYGIYGDRLEWPVVAPTVINLNQRLKEEDDAIPQERYSPGIGYSFVTESVSTEIATVNTVIEQYTPSFNSGALDPEKALPEFIDALKAAGIDTIIEENQKQFDEWMATSADR